MTGTRVQLLHEVIDLSFVLAFSGIGALFTMFLAAVMRLDPDRLARVVLLGNLGGALVGFVVFLLAVLGVL
jgi:hypothetical protein